MALKSLEPFLLLLLLLLLFCVFFVFEFLSRLFAFIFMSFVLFLYHVYIVCLFINVFIVTNLSDKTKQEYIYIYICPVRPRFISAKSAQLIKPDTAAGVVWSLVGVIGHKARERKPYSFGQPRPRSKAEQSHRFVSVVECSIKVKRSNYYV